MRTEWTPTNRLVPRDLSINNQDSLSSRNSGDHFSIRLFARGCANFSAIPKVFRESVVLIFDGEPEYMIGGNDATGPIGPFVATPNPTLPLLFWQSSPSLHRSGRIQLLLCGPEKMIPCSSVLATMIRELEMQSTRSSLERAYSQAEYCVSWLPSTSNPTCLSYFPKNM